MIFKRYRFVILVALPFAAAHARPQEPAAGARVAGVVYDSVAHRPLSGAFVQLVLADSITARVRTAMSDQRGRFELTGVPDGHYRIGFFHPMLDSLMIEPILREVQVVARRRVRVDLAIPSPARLRAAICGPRAQGDSSAVIVGIVRTAADGERAPDVSVVAEWNEIEFTQRGIRHRMPRRESMTGEPGWFALCDLPTTGSMVMRAIRGADSTAAIQVDLPADGFARRDLYLGVTAARTASINARRPPSR